MIRFTDSADSILEYPMSRVILIDASLQSKDAVIDRIEKALEGLQEIQAFLVNLMS